MNIPGFSAEFALVSNANYGLNELHPSLNGLRMTIIPQVQSGGGSTPPPYKKDFQNAVQPLLRFDGDGDVCDIEYCAHCTSIGKHCCNWYGICQCCEPPRLYSKGFFSQ